MIRPVSTFLVTATLPDQLRPLAELSRNFWWCWNNDAIALWASIDHSLWDSTHHNPVLMLQQVSHTRLQALQSDEQFLQNMRSVHARFVDYLSIKCEPQIAYFCAEFGLHESFQMYSGGLGVLAGDHLKSASDLGVPLVGIGLLYQEGYFRQYLTENGWQNEHYHELDFHGIPIEQVLTADGKPLRISVEMPLGNCHAGVWKATVGRVTLYLLDTNVDENSEAVLRDVTDRLYGGTTDTRIMQELMLGIGGMRALEAMGINPQACHINEGHAAFSMLERTRQIMQAHHLSFHEAWKVMQSASIFTTHTPVPAGNEVFDVATLLPYLRHYITAMGISWEEFADLGNTGHGAHTSFSMTILGIRGSSFRNGVSALHGHVAREMWHKIWADYPVDEAPINGLVNGVHTATWVAPELAKLYDRHLGIAWRTTPWHESSWKDIRSVPDEELWTVHAQRRRRLVDGTRKHIVEKHHASLTQKQALTIHRCLDPEALTVGFARRFATYKRADLLMRDMDRLSGIVRNASRPVQFILAGKAHPRDVQGKELIQRVHQMIREYDLDHSIVFLEDYEMDVARLLVRGCDVWLNTPRKPHEASGTSGMKAAINGVLHCSILDGWWAEAYNGTNGWAIGRGEMFDEEEQDNADSATLYDILEYDIIPRFYDRGSNGIPHQWVAMMKESIRTNAWRFAAERMVHDYHLQAYQPAQERARRYAADNGALARELVAFEHILKEQWSTVRVHQVESHTNEHSRVGDVINVHAQIEIGTFAPENLRVQIINGPVNARHEIMKESVAEMSLVSLNGHHAHYVGATTCTSSGFHGCTVRVMPTHPGMLSPIESGLLRYPENA
ncbi:MAG: alpha-glucan family phosphorylase [Ignavibacteria bacterium]|jgi:starch phosphorylase